MDAASKNAALDEELAALARAESGLRLRLGQVLEVLGRGKHFELGFSSVAAYALERCDRSVRWVEGARCLARRLEALPELRRAIAFGSVSWSMGELLARVAQPEDEASWIESAAGRTVREMRERLVACTRDQRARDRALKGSVAAAAVSREPAACEGPAGACTTMGGVHASGLSSDSDGESDGENDCENDCENDEPCTLTCRVDQEDAWLFEATRTLLVQLGVYDVDSQVEALLAEAQDTLLAALPKGGLDLDRMHELDALQRGRMQELGRCRTQVEAICEKHFRNSILGSSVDLNQAEVARDRAAKDAAVGLASLESASSDDLDRAVRELSRSLARHELELSQLVLRFHRADGWRRLGYASDTQYARERLGMSRSSLVARRALAARLEKLPRVAEALGAGQIGVEAAVQVVRVATPITEAAWVGRARHRTIKHLREEVAAALIAVRMSGEADCPPPMDAEMTSFHQLEQSVVSGRACQRRPASSGRAERAVDRQRLTEPGSAPRRAWLVMLSSLASWLDAGLQLSATSGSSRASRLASKGRIELRWRMSPANYAWWRGLEAQALRWLPEGTSWLRFLCLSLWKAWRHLLGADVAHARIYIRDRYRCSSPVCNRRDVTPHHLHFRSAGGGDEDENVAALCTWCHLFGVHGGRIRAVGPAQCIRWELGTAGCPCLVVHGRERLAA